MKGGGGVGETYGGGHFLGAISVINEGQKIKLVKMKDKVSSVRLLCGEDKVERE